MKSNLKFSKDRNFGIGIGIIFLIIYIFSLNNFELRINNYILISLLFFFISIIKPNLLNLLNFFTFKIGLIFMRVVSNLNIFIIYFIIIGLTGLLMRAFSYDPLFLKKSKINKSPSFWRKRHQKYDDIHSMKNQF